MVKQHQVNNPAIGKTFLIGAITPFATIFCSLTRQSKPKWLIQEFSQTSHGLQQAALGLGLGIGLVGIAGGPAMLVYFSADKVLAPPTPYHIKPTESEKAPVPPAKDGEKSNDDANIRRPNQHSKVQYANLILPYDRV